MELAIRTASSSESNVVIGATGPKISSLAMSDVVATPDSTVGS